MFPDFATLMARCTTIPGHVGGASRTTETAVVKSRPSTMSTPATITALPHTATGKVLKTKLREDFRDHKLPSD
jgi:acyl-CoA synthetase (AMP-forming)/AMP-acid ligase II